MLDPFIRGLPCQRLYRAKVMTKDAFSLTQNARRTSRGRYQGNLGTNHNKFSETLQINDRTSLQASCLGGGGAIEGKMERELTTTSQEFEYPHRKFRCNMLIGGDLIW